jgi:hypothetical protein
VYVSDRPTPSSGSGARASRALSSTCARPVRTGSKR